MSTTTEHYELNIAEGTDLVNPLIDTFPNFTKIDEAMWNNKLGGVILATHLLSGSVHTITLEPQDATVFRFVATADYTVGQTFTVNGQQVTGLTTNGTTLSNKAFVINQNVLCCLVGTNLTFYVNNNVDEAEDSKKLGGQLPAYYATAEQAQSAINTAQAAQTIAQGAQTTANNALTTSLSMTSVWTNPNPSQSVQSNTKISIDLSGYNYVLIIAYTSTSNMDIGDTILVPVGTGGRLVTMFGSDHYLRTFSVDSEGISFGNVTYPNTCIPYQIFGFKNIRV